MMKTYSFLLLSLISFHTFSAGDPRALFERLDQNRDGFISKSEASSEPNLWSRFGSYDRDKDGKLSLSEFTVYARQ